MLQIEPNNTENVAEHVIKLENDLNIVLPEDYKQFLIKYNGGWTPGTKIYFNDFDYGINGFNGVNKAEGASNFYWYINNSVDPIREEFFEDLGNGFLNIGDDFGSNFYVNIDKNSDKYGGIYSMDRVDDDDYIYVCSSFKELSQKARTPDFHVNTTEENIRIYKEKGKEDKLTPSLIKRWEKIYEERKDIKLVPVIID